MSLMIKKTCRLHILLYYQHIDHSLEAENPPPSLVIWRELLM